MREIDDRYPEYAEPYEPVRGARHHKGLYHALKNTSRRSSLKMSFAVGAVLLLLVAVLGRQGTGPGQPVPEGPEQPIQIALEPKPDPDDPASPPGDETQEELPEVPSEEQTQGDPTEVPPEDETAEPTETETEPVTTPTTEAPVTVTAAPVTQKTTRRQTTTRTTESTTTTTTESVDPVPDLKDPEITIDNVRYWGEFNSWYGLQHLQVEYTITPNDADNGSLSSYGSVSMVTGSTGSASWSAVAGDGTIQADVNCAGTGLFPNSVSEWLTEVTLEYTLNGEARTKTVSVQGRPDLYSCHMEAELISAETEADGRVSAEYRVRVTCSASDTHEYNPSFTGAEIIWYDEYHNQVGSPRSIWSGGGDSPFTGNGTHTAGDDRYMEYTFRSGPIDVTPPSGEATCFRFSFNAEDRGADAYDSSLELTSWDWDYLDLP